VRYVLPNPALLCRTTIVLALDFCFLILEMLTYASPPSISIYQGNGHPPLSSLGQIIPSVAGFHILPLLLLPPPTNGSPSYLLVAGRNPATLFLTSSKTISTLPTPLPPLTRPILSIPLLHCGHNYRVLQQSSLYIPS